MTVMATVREKCLVEMGKALTLWGKDMVRTRGLIDGIRWQESFEPI